MLDLYLCPIKSHYCLSWLKYFCKMFGFEWEMPFQPCTTLMMKFLECSDKNGFVFFYGKTLKIQFRALFNEDKSAGFSPHFYRKRNIFKDMLLWSFQTCLNFIYWIELLVTQWRGKVGWYHLGLYSQNKSLLINRSRFWEGEVINSELTSHTPWVRRKCSLGRCHGHEK